MQSNLNQRIEVSWEHLARQLCNQSRVSLGLVALLRQKRQASFCQSSVSRRLLRSSELLWTVELLQPGDGLVNQAQSCGRSCERVHELLVLRLAVLCGLMDHLVNVLNLLSECFDLRNSCCELILLLCDFRVGLLNGL